ncbi:hypothetical protein [Streptomyces sp. SID13031]|uniref:hypothetical protein n=1 Tax=Streptomyces sp. SID13031 TaxID=2706046 RepID=UPI0013CC8046|nr:hypothetical protein [Streptomyces sp. SID13031]NEA34500.1 hypothetical protein [Streptomyces sp. SID13031]
MSSLLRPVGHLPASVYWFRRALVLVVLVALVFVLVRVVSGGGDPKNSAATDPGQNPSSGPTVVPTPTPGAKSSGKTEGKTTKATETPKTSETPKDVQCQGDDVTIDVVPVSRTLAAGNSLNLVIQLSAVRDECKAAIDPSELSLTVTSGKDQIWTTEHCEKVIPRATLVLAKGKQSTATVLWDGRRSRPGCLPGQLQAKPGTYVVKAIYDGRASAAQAFTIV